MALALRFAEEAEFTSRACIVSYEDEEVEKEPVQAIFRWSKEMRAKLETQYMTTKQLIIATKGAPNVFLEQWTREWRVVGTLIVTDQDTPLVRMDQSHVGACQVVWNESNDEMAVLVPTSISSSAVWSWSKAIFAHIHAENIIVLDAQLSTIHDFGYGTADDLPILRSLSTDRAPTTSVPKLTTPRMLTGVPAALLTLGQLHHHRVTAYVSLYSANAVASEILQSFLPLQEFFRTCRKSQVSSQLVDVFHALYT